MSAVHQSSENALDRRFAAPYCSFSDADLLSHFQSRRPVTYFPVVDEPQVTADKLEGILHNRFDFNGECYALGPAFDWRSNPSSDIEWLILLHKFYYAVGLGRAYAETGETRFALKWVQLTQAWMDSVPVDFLSSDVTGRRVQNWIFAHYYMISSHTTFALTPGFYRAFLHSLHAQVTHLCGHLTPARNHRTLELYAIFLASVVFPEFVDAAYWRSFSLTELHRNILTDVLDDGVHCELSTDYHHIVLRNYLGIKRLAVMNGIALPVDMDERIIKALDFSLHVHKPDGCIPAISDGDTGNFLYLLEQGHDLYGRQDYRYVATQGTAGTPPRDRCQGFSDSGYYLLRSDWQTPVEPYSDARYLLFDCAALGAGNHGHLDLLNIEVAAYGRSLIVDPGRYTYDESGPLNWRVHFRSTSAHNTVVVDGKNQTRYEFYGQKFKLRGPEPDRELRAFASIDACDYLHGIAASHEYPVIHERKIAFVLQRYWVVVDVLRALDGAEHDYELFYHLAAEAWQDAHLIAGVTDTCLWAPGLAILSPFADGAAVELREDYVSAVYGKKEQAPLASYRQSGVTAVFHTLLYPYRTVRPHLTLCTLPVTMQGQLCPATQATALKISITESGVVHQDTLYFCHDQQTLPHHIEEQAYCAVFAFMRQDISGQVTARSCYSGEAFE